MNKNDRTEQDIHDQLVNLVTSLTPVIGALRELIKRADDAVARRLERSLSGIDSKVNEVSSAIEELGSSASTTSQALSQYQELVLKQLQAAVTAFTDNEMPRRYDNKIAGIITDMKQQIDTAVQSVVTAKNASIEVQISTMQGVADKLSESADNLALFTNQYQAGHKQIIEDIETFETFETTTKTRIEQVEGRASKDLDKIHKSIETMSIKRIAAAVAAGTVAVIISLVALVFWYVPSFDEIAEMKYQQAELQRGIDELETGWRQAFDDAQSQQIILACDVDEAQPDAISWCVRADSKSVLRDERGFVYYKIAGVPRAEPTE